MCDLGRCGRLLVVVEVGRTADVPGRLGKVEAPPLVDLVAGYFTHNA